MNIIIEENDIPIISCSIFASFANRVDGIAFSNFMKKIGIIAETYNCKATNEFRVRIAYIHAAECWEFSDVLNEVFLKIQDNYSRVKKAIIDYKATCLIDIVCYKKNTYPSMLIDGDAMKFIHELNADISIDMYDQ